MADALRRLGHDVQPFEWHRYVGVGPDAGLSAGGVLRRAQNKYLVGPLVRRINADLLAMVAAARPDLLFVYRGTHVTRGTLEAIRRATPGTRLVGYNNDDPFAPGQASWPWRHFIGAIPAYDRMLAYRAHNLQEYAARGARATGLLLPWFVPSVHRPMTLTEDECRRYTCDAVFVGHYEEDGRLEALDALVRAGIRVRVYGPPTGFPGHDWHGPLSRTPALGPLMPVHMIWDEDYARALSASRVGLCFLSKRNRDQYTRRCFEIPATGTLLMSEYSAELAGLYREGTDAEFFRTPGELVEKVRFYLDRPDARNAVASSGRERVHRNGHDVDSRMRTMLAELERA